MAASDIVYAYKDVYCTTGTVSGNADVVLSVQFTFTGTRNGVTAENSYLYTYEDPIFDDSNPYMSFEAWKQQKMYALLDALVLAYKWKSVIRAKLDTADKNLVTRPIEETITPPVVPDATNDAAAEEQPAV